MKASPTGATAVPPLNEPVYLRVKRAILADLVAGEFVPGMHLTIDALTSRYGVSHMPIREALRQLEGEGILISLAHRGFKIETVTEDYIRKIYDIRVGIESLLAHRAAELATDEDIREIRQMHEDLSAMIREGGGVPAALENVKFHKRIYSIARNPEAELILEGRTRVVRTVGDGLGGYTPDVYETVIAEHEKMVLALERKDPKAAGDAVFDHVTAARDRLLEKMALTHGFPPEGVPSSSSKLASGPI